MAAALIITECICATGRFLTMSITCRLATLAVDNGGSVISCIHAFPHSLKPRRICLSCSNFSHSQQDELHGQILWSTVISRLSLWCSVGNEGTCYIGTTTMDDGGTTVNIHSSLPVHPVRAKEKTRALSMSERPCLPFQPEIRLPKGIRPLAPCLGQPT